MMNLEVAKGLERQHLLVFLTYLLESEPQTFKEVVSSPKGRLWKEVIKSEIVHSVEPYLELLDFPLVVSL